MKSLFFSLPVMPLLLCGGILAKIQLESAEFSQAILIWLIAAFVADAILPKWKWLILLLSTAVGVVVLRPSNWPTILGSIFSLRLVLFLIEVRKSAELRDFKSALAYFFLLPNISMVLFPLISYEKFAFGLKEKLNSELFRSGVHFVTVGVLQLLLYKAIRYRYYIPFENIHSWGEYFRFLCLNFLLYLRISGMFHIVIGGLHLFGISLPRVNNFYFFSTGFIDFWRRINIYFRDFVIKLLFHPTYFLLRRRGHRSAFLTAIAVVLFGSWFLHGVIYFFSFGKFRITQGESVFWLLWGSGIFFGSLYEEYYKSSRRPSWFSLFFRISLFSLILTFLWSISTSEDVLKYLVGISYLEWGGVSEFMWILIFPLIGFFGAWYRKRVEGRNELIFGAGTWMSAGGIVLLVLMFQGRFDIPQSSNVSEDAAVRLQNRDYYSGLQLNRLQPDDDPQGRQLLGENLLVDVDDFRFKKWNSNLNTNFMGHAFKTNSLGMPSAEVQPKIDSRTRLAILGSCVGMSWGVDFGQEWPVVAAREMNKVKTSFEILNFSVPSYGLPIYPYVAEIQAAPLRPDYLIVEIVAGTVSQSGHIAVRAVQNRLRIPYPELYNALGVSEESSIKLRHFPDTISEHRAFTVAEMSLDRLVGVAKNIGAKLVLVRMPDQLLEPGVTEAADQSKFLNLIRDRKTTVIDLSKEFNGQDLKRMIIRDDNMSAEGHAVVGEAFAREFMKLIASP